jgi:hypothetical protein
VTIDDPDNAQEAGLVITNTPGNTATVRFEWTPDPDDQGSYVLTLTARDDFIPPGETVKTLTIDVECTPSTPLPMVSEEISGLASDSRTGTSVSAAGDLNHDGLMDFIAGAPGYEDNAPVEAGAGAVYLGSMDPEERARPDIIFVGELEHDRAGVSVAGNFDFNGDGTPDLLIGAEQVNRTPDNDVNCDSGQGCGPGRTYLIYFDPDDATLYPNIDNDGTADLVDLSDVGTLVPGAVFDGDATGDQAGFSVAAGGPIEASPAGGPDIAIGAPGRDVPDPMGDRTDAGSAYVIFNQPLSGSYNLSQVAGSLGGVVYLGAAAGDRLGFAVDFPGDVVEPAGEDFAMGAPEADPVPIGIDQDELMRGGIGFMASGGEVSSGIIEVEDIGQTGDADGTIEFLVEGVRIQGTQAEMQLGYSIAGGGDNLRNGEPDLLIGAPFYNVPVPGGTDQDELSRGGFTSQTAGSLERGIIEVEDIGTSGTDGPGGIEGVRYVGAAAGDELGTAVGGIRDVTGNGSDDIAMGAPLSDVDGTSNAGRVYVVEGTPPPGPEDEPVEFFLGVISVDAIGASISGRQLTGTQPNEEAGTSVADTGDVDGDGLNDFVVGSPGKDLDTGGISLVDEGTDVPSTLPNSPPTANASATQTPDRHLRMDRFGRDGGFGSGAGKRLPAVRDPERDPPGDRFLRGGRYRHDLRDGPGHRPTERHDLPAERGGFLLRRDRGGGGHLCR